MAESKWSGSGGAGGSGDVFGPPSSTDNAIARFDGTSGDTIQNSPVTISDSGVMVGATIDGDDNTVQDLPLSALKTVVGDADEILRRDSAGAVVSGPTTIDGDGNINNSKTLDLRNDDDLSGNGAYMVRMTNHNSTTGSHPFVSFQRSRSSNADLQNGDEVGGLEFRPRFNSLTQTTAKIQTVYTGDGTTRLSDIVFQTSNGGAPAERMRIAADGKVTIAGDFEVQGTTTTINTQTLEVEDANIRINKGGNNTSAAGAGLTVEGTGASTLATIQYDSALASRWKVGASGSEDEVVTRTTTQTLTNKTLTTPVISQISNTGTLTLPTSTDTLVGRATTDTLTNKTLTNPVISQISNTGTLTLPTSTDTLVGRATTDTLSNKTLDAPVIDNALVMNHESTPATPSAGTVKVYPKSDNNLYILDPNGVETPVGSGTAAGFVNYIKNADAESSTTGWVTYADAAGTTPVDGTGGSPNITWTRNTSSPLRGNADFAFFKPTPTVTQGEGVSYDFTISVADQSKKCQISFDYNTTSADYTAGDLRVFIYDITNATLITPQTADIPKAIGTFQTTFDTTTSTSYRLIIHCASSGSAGFTAYFDNFIVNAGQVVQGAAMSGPTNHTPTLTWSGGTTSTIVTNSTTWYRSGDRMIFNLSIDSLTTATATPTGLDISLPTGYTIGGNSGQRFYGAADCFALLSDRTGAVLQAIQGSTSIGLSLGAGVTWATTGSGRGLRGTIEFPIAEWAGNGTVNLGPGAQVEFASVGGTWDADSSTTVYGPAGVQITGALTTTRIKTITWQYPIQADDMIIVEGSSDGLRWWPMTQNYPYSLSSAGSNATSAGVFISSQTSTTTVVQFCRYAAIANDDSPAYDWGTSVWWRVRKAKASSPVGFGLAGTDGSSGLYMAGRAPGLTTGAAVPAGMIGEYFDNGSSTFFTTTPANIISRTLQPGLWRIAAYTYVNSGAGPTWVQVSISPTSATHDTYNRAWTVISSGVASISTETIVNLNTATTYYLVGSSGTASVNNAQTTRLICHRIA